MLEFVSGGGLAGRPVPPTLAREGAAMRDALVADLAAIPGIQVLAAADPRFPLPPAARAEVTRIERPARLRRLFARADAVWLIAPESRGRLARLAAAVEAAGVPLLGPSADAICMAGNKLQLARTLATAGVPVPATRAVRLVPAGAHPATRPGAALPFPLVAKPARGAGCEGVALARTPAEWPRALALAGGAGARGAVLVQPYLDGVAASVSLVCDGRRALPLAVNRQHIRPGAPFAYDGGETPLDHPLAGRAIERALAACSAIPGLRGYVGVDVVLTGADAVVLEVNPRLTTSYLGLRRALDANPAALALEAALGRLPAAPRAARRVRFLSSGAITGEEALP